MMRMDTLLPSFDPSEAGRRFAVMNVDTTRFGPLDVALDDLIHFPAGMLGLEDCRHWVLLADAQNDSLAWLQSASRPEVALAVVSPRRFVPDYQMRLVKSEIAPLELATVQEAQVLTIVSKNERSITLNLKAPLVINLERRLGRQVIVTSDESVEYELGAPRMPLRKSA
jgi:flagellar assembly factor FliW